MTKNNIIKILKWLLPTGTIFPLFGWFFNAYNAQYDKGVQHGEMNLKTKNYHLVKSNDSLKKMTMSFKDSLFKLNQIIKSNQGSQFANTNVIFINKSNKYVLFSYF